MAPIRPVLRLALAAAAVVAAAPVRAGGFTLLDSTDRAGRFEALARLSTRSQRVWIEKGTSIVDVSGQAKPVWWTTQPTAGAQAVDRLDGPVAWLFKILTVGIMAAPVSEVGRDANYVYYAGKDASDFIHVPLPQAVFTLDWGEDMRGLTLSGSDGRYIGMTFGYRQYPTWKGVPEMTASSALPRGKAADFLRSSGAYWATVLPSQEFTADVNVRVPIDVPVLGGVSLVWDLPMVYSTMAIFSAVFNGGPDDGELDDWGIPRFRVQVSRSLGPLTLAAEYAIPTKYLVVPAYTDGQHFGVLAGFRF